MLIKNAECFQFKQKNEITWCIQDVRIEQGIVAALGKLELKPGEPVMDAAGASLLPGLHDHHVHLASYAASLGSVSCGPPVVRSKSALIKQLNQASDGNGWLRGINYHESVAGDIDRHWLDTHGPKRPIRIQHRSGRLWILNSNALEVIKNTSLPPVESCSKLDAEDGRLYDVDNVLRNFTKDIPLPVATASQNLASFGVTGINDMTHTNDLSTYKWFSELQATGALLQKIRLSGAEELSTAGKTTEKLMIGERKIHLHESDLPDFYDLCQTITTSHYENRAVAIHCVTETELVFTLAVLQETGVRSGDRIEHASVIPPAVLEQVQDSGLCVVTQPNFILERGDAYLDEIPESEHTWLYRCRSLVERSIPLAFGTDLPFGNPDPWVAIKTATNRQTGSGRILGENESMTPEAALSRFVGKLENPSIPRSITVGEPADFCLLDCPWRIARLELSSSRVRATILTGELIYQK